MTDKTFIFSKGFLNLYSPKPRHLVKKLEAFLQGESQSQPKLMVIPPSHTFSFYPWAGEATPIPTSWLLC